MASALLCASACAHGRAPAVRAGACTTGLEWARYGSSYVHYNPPSKLTKKRRKGFAIHNQFVSANDPKLVPKNLRLAERRARELGVVDAITAFDEAAAAFPNPTPLVACTLLERANIVMRDVEEWESDFWEWQESREEAVNKRYPDKYIDRTLAQSMAKEAAEGDSGNVASGASSLDQFFTADDADTVDDDIDLKDFQPAPRFTSADLVDDKRSLERALQERLVLLVSEGDDSWSFPGIARDDGEAMVEAARHGLEATCGDNMHVWYPGNAPVGHWLQVYDEAKQEETGSYGAKVFFYRAEIMAGRVELTDEEMDYKWLTRDECCDVLDGPFFSYMHQIIGAGAGEEHRRRAAARANKEGAVEE